MGKDLNLETRKGRQRVQIHFWNMVGSAEHINLPKLEYAIKKEFCCSDDRFVEAQIRLMQTEGRIRVQSNVKVWIKQPKTLLSL
jgi:hypothetical protein